MFCSLSSILLLCSSITLQNFPDTYVIHGDHTLEDTEKGNPKMYVGGANLLERLMVSYERLPSHRDDTFSHTYK